VCVAAACTSADTGADTTRAPRAGEADGREYHFVTPEQFAQLKADGAFVETAQFSGNSYGTSIAAVRAVAAQGRRCILDIEAQGVRQLKRTDLRAVYVFLAPPSRAALRARLAGRGTETADAVAKRLAAALEEAAYAREGAHDVVIVNDTLERAYALLREVALGVPIVGDALPPLDDE
jgi:guanylate kinase